MFKEDENDKDYIAQDAHITTQGIRLLNGIYVKVIVNFESESLDLTLTESYSNKKCISMDGISAFQQKQYRLGNGSFITDESGFSKQLEVKSNVLH
ncbi:hypothetical protein DPMN_137350 [Dreissena polymorpha]|uniref:Uncharacterized protein n=1 Tax=Dreissena polymorpha TaxID=45954 RepID=A0A9D4G1R2_DREPO|nr:hypothetical protein DPMN_137350 [Dreissena polymorpha]